MIIDTHPTHSLAPLLQWLHRLLAWQVQVTRATYAALADDAYRGLYLPDQEIDILCADWPALSAELQHMRTELAEERAALAAEQRSAAEAGLSLPLEQLRRRFNLSLFEVDVVLLALAPEIDSRYERLYGYVQDDVTRKRPTVELALRLLCPDPAERHAARAQLADGAPLISAQLVRLEPDAQRPHGSLLRAISLDERMVTELIGQPLLDQALALWVKPLQPRHTLDDMVGDGAWLAQTQQFVLQHPNGLVLGLYGGYGSGRRMLTEALAHAAARPVLEVDATAALGCALEPEEALMRLRREAQLRAAVLLFRSVGPWLNETAHSRWRSAWLSLLERYQGLTVLALDQPLEAHGWLRETTYLYRVVPDLAYSQRERLWQRWLAPAIPDAATLRQLSSTFRLSGGQIVDAVTMAQSLARWRTGSGDAVPTPAELFAACRAQSSGRMADLAQKIVPVYSWDDLVLPAEHLQQLQEICVQMRQRRMVLEEWGFERHLANGKGINVLFAGQSGTGKTMAAEVIAAELGLELYRVDLSSLVSKYIGETEKNLDRIFQAAREANAILFFDEADAIFGKRSEVKDAHDRYANIEVGYLLQKMEAYDGMVILATNLRKNMDDAFVRRLHMAIDFPFPEETDRLRIWQHVFPSLAPRAQDLDLSFLARQFRLAGGNIRNIALLSAFLAAEDQQSISMAHVIRATRREYQKLGRLVTEADFGPYLELTRGNGQPGGVR